MQFTKSSSKALEYIHGEWYILDINNGAFLKRKYCLTWLCKHNGYCLSKEQVSKVENSKLFKPLANKSISLVCGVVAMIGAILKVSGVSFDLVLDFPIYINFIIVLSNYTLLIIVAKTICKKDKKHLDLLINEDAKWDCYVKIDFPTKSSKLKYLILMLIIQLLFISMLIGGILLFFITHAVIFLLLTDIILFYSLMVTIRQPRNFTYRVD